MKKKLLSIGMIFVIILLSGCSFAGNYYKDGKKSFEKGEYEVAADDFSKAIAANPNRAQYYIDYGLALVALGKYEDALKQFDLAYRDKDMAVIRENNKRALRGKGIAYYKMQEYKKAIKEFTNALKIDELSALDVDILSYMGSAYGAVGMYKEAVETYTDILKDQKDNAQAYADRAFCYRCLGSYKESLSDYNRAITLKSSNFDFYFGKYNLLMDQGDLASAKEVLAKASDIKVSTEEDKYNLAKLHFYQENYGTALTELESSFKAGINEADYYIGEIYRIQKDYTKAAYYYENYIKTGKVLTPNVYNQIAVCLIREGDSNKALEYLKTGIEWNEAATLRILKKNEIIAYEKLGEFDTADEKLDAYLESYPEDKTAAREAEFVDTRLTK